MQTQDNDPRADRFVWFLGVACVALATLVALLAWQNFRLKADLAAAHAGEAPRNALEAGDSIGSLVLVDAAGTSRPQAFDGGAERTLLLLFTLDCPACQKTFPVWNDLFAGGEYDGVRVIGVQLDRGPEQKSDAVFPFDVFAVDHATSESISRIPYVPAMLLLDGRGVVLRAWYGMLTREQETELRESLATG